VEKAGKRVEDDCRLRGSADGRYNLGQETYMITLRQYAPGEAIIRENEKGECAYIIEKGRVEITREKEGKPSHIAYLETGMTFGEMSMVDDLPRSATVTAVEETVVREVHRDNLYENLTSNPGTMIKLLKGIFERLRIANATIARMKEEAKASKAAVPASTPSPDSVPFPFQRPAPRPEPARMEPGGVKSVRIEGLTPRAVESLQENPAIFATLPIKVGRRTNDPLVQNHLEIADRDPLQISRHHVSIIQEGGMVGVLDRGSHLGASVDDERIGGKAASPGPVFFKGGEGVLVLGTDKSPYRFKVTIER
jgi:CRP-like cAMP-binding protein